MSENLQSNLSLEDLKEHLGTFREWINDAVESKDKQVVDVVFDLYVIEKKRWQRNKPLSSIYHAYLVDLDDNARSKISEFVYQTFNDLSSDINKGKYTIKDFFSYEPKHRTDLMVISPRNVDSFLEIKRQILQGGRALKKSVRDLQDAKGFVFYFDFGKSGKLMIITRRRSPLSLRNKKNKLWIIPRDNKIEVTMDVVPVPVDSMDALYFEYNPDDENRYSELIVNNKGHFETLFGFDKIYEKHAKSVLKRLKARKILNISDKSISDIVSKKSSFRKDITNLAKTGVLRFLYIEKSSPEYEKTYREFISRMAVYAKLRGSKVVEITPAEKEELPKVSIHIDKDEDIKTFIDLCKKRYTVDYSSGEPILIEVEQGTPLGPIEEEIIEEARESIMYWIQKYAPNPAS